jgi:hypothetical protein
MDYAVIYRTGGTKRCEWRRVFVVYRTLDAANAGVERLERMGYKALRFEAATLDAIGLPIGWEPKSVDFERDQIIVDRYATLHVKAA